MMHLRRPFKGPVQISQPFGPTSFEGEPAAFGHPHFHLGVDYALPSGSCILAPMFGRVIRADWDDTGFGQHVRIDHGLGVVSLLAHLSEYKCAVGDQVNAGELIGLSGSTGNSTGPHLHWSTLLHGVWTDPALFVFA
jgi:murein DD-endopeptidase MepM/ murein hydrolase activator NlpD